MTKKRVIFDTNTLVSSILIITSIPSQVLDSVRQDEKISIIFSEETFQELKTVLNRPKFDRYVIPSVRLEFIQTLQTEAEFCSIIQEVQLCRDPKDNKFLELAVSGKADYLITGDHALLVLNPFENTTILTPAQFLEALAN